LLFKLWQNMSDNPFDNGKVYAFIIMCNVVSDIVNTFNIVSFKILKEASIGRFFYFVKLFGDRS